MDASARREGGLEPVDVRHREREPELDGLAAHLVLAAAIVLAIGFFIYGPQFLVALIGLYGASLKASFDYVSFMKVEKSSYLKVRMDWLYSIYVVFLVAIVARYLWLLSRLLRGKDPQAGDGEVTKVSSGL